ncbi:JAB domain-containing protein [Anaerovorax odorimutans]|uniref:JAB domain-containing protein n=1 Tax=Anaerovorax odorimutans TaxID=109327 RepID=UPI000423CCD0|nr:JAB domain-containing protein [Anaerovorax odorimutans]
MKKEVSAKRVNIVNVKLVKEKSIKYQPRKITTPKDVVNLVGNLLIDCDREKLILITLNVKNEPTFIEVVSVGNLQSAIIHPREIFKTAILGNAANIIICHNHPSGDLEPSKEDIKITQRLKECGKLMGIELTDHIIIGSEGRFCSLQEKGLFK